MSEGRRLFVGLGNPGKKYALTRHNLGAMVVEEFAAQNGWRFQESKSFCAMGAKGVFQGKEVHLLLPQTYMNESGWSVRKYLDYYKWPIQSLVIICDDIALPFGQYRLRSQGSSGGHNGIKSLISHLGGEAFARLRMGIGRGDSDEKSLADYVLDPFSPAEIAELPAVIKAGTNIIGALAVESVEFVMNQVNNRESQVPKN